MIFDTDIFIWVQKSHPKAATLLNETVERYISIQTYMELLEGAKDKTQLKQNKDFLKKLEFSVLPMSENISHRAAIYIEQYGLSHAMRSADAIIAATASETGRILCAANAKHYRQIPDLDLKIFKP